MATSGQIQTNTAFGYVRLAWSTSSQSINNNSSLVNYTLSISRNLAIISTTSKPYSITINGVTVASGKTTIGGSGVKTIKSGSTTIPHNVDGSKTFALSFSQQINVNWDGTYIGTVTGNGTGTLDTIPRATTPTLSAASTEMGSAVTITLNRASDNFTHNMSYQFGTAQEDIVIGASTSYVWTIPETLASQIPNATSGTGAIYCDTYNGLTLVGSTVIYFVATVPDTIDFKPTIDDVAISEGNATVTAGNFGAYIQKQSKVNVAATSNGVYGSSIVSTKITIDGIVYVGATVANAHLYNSGNVQVIVDVVDSRGRTERSTQTINVLPYETPKITSFYVIRCNALGEEDYEGTHVKATVKFDISTLNDKNTKYYEVVYRIKGATSWTGAISSGNVYTYDGNIVSTSLFNADNPYELKLQLYDTFGEAAVYGEIPTAFTLVDFRSTGKGVAFGKVSESDKMEIALDVAITGTLEQEEIQRPTLQNSWVDYGSGFEGAGYWKDTCGVVHLCGLIDAGITTYNTTIFTLPVGYRPANNHKFLTVSLNATCTLNVYATGEVAIMSGGTGGTVSLSGINFRVT